MISAHDVRSQAENDTFMMEMARQERERRAQDVKDGFLLEAADLATRLQISEQALEAFSRAGAVFFFEGNGGNRLYPAFYADRDITFEKLEAVTRVLHAMPASAQWQFFTLPRHSLQGRTALQALKDGDFDAVMVSATGFAER